MISGICICGSPAGFSFARIRNAGKTPGFSKGYFARLFRAVLLGFIPERFEPPDKCRTAD